MVQTCIFYGTKLIIMKRILTILTALAVIWGCEKPSTEIEKIEGLTIQNFPVIDGSDSTTPLRQILAARLLGLDYRWERRPFADGDIFQALISPDGCTDDDWHTLNADKLQENNTHASFINLIDGKVDVILTARSISRDEKAYSQEKGVELIEKPIARDAFIFLINPDNPVSSLTISQIQDIYTGKITNWKEVGGEDRPITAYTRNRNSGSQEKMETLVMAGLEMIEGTEMSVGQTMMSPYYQIGGDISGIGYTPFYYYDTIVNNGETKAVGVNGTVPSKKTIKDRSYPYCTEIYAAVRADIDRTSLAWLLFEYLSSGSGIRIIEESGYIRL